MSSKKRQREFRAQRPHGMFKLQMKNTQINGLIRKFVQTHPQISPIRVEQLHIAEKQTIVSSHKQKL